MKAVRQLGIKIKDEPGVLSDINDLLSANGINIIAFHTFREKDAFGLHLVLDNSDKALNVFRTAGYETDVIEVIACRMPDHPGGLSAVLKPLKGANINIEYIYPCLGTNNGTLLIMGVNSLEKALKLMRDNWIDLLDADELIRA